MSASSSDLLTTAEVASIFRVSRSAVRTWVKDGRLRAIRVAPKTIRYHRTDVEALLAGPPEPVAVAE